MTFEQFRTTIKARWPDQNFFFGSSEPFFDDQRHSAETVTYGHWWKVKHDCVNWVVQSQDQFYKPRPDRVEFIAAGGDTLDEALANLHEVMLYEYTEERE